MITIPELVMRMQQIAVIDRYAAQQRLDEVLTGTYQPSPGDILPPWKQGTARRLAWERALAKTQTEGPRVLGERLASAMGTVSWVNADTGQEDDRINDALNALDLEGVIRSGIVDYVSNGIAVVLPYRDPETGEPRLEHLTGMHEPYTDPQNQNRITGLFRTMSYISSSGRIKWRTEVYDWEDSEDGMAVHRYWNDLAKPTDLAGEPDEFPRAPRPLFVIDRTTNDGLPVGQLEMASPIMLGLYATELMLATTEEISAYPMLKVKGSTKGINQVGTAEVVAVDRDGDAEWMTPGSLAELEGRRRVKREAVREAAFLYAGSLGTDTPSGEALIQANRVPMQADSDVAKAMSSMMSDAATLYLGMLNLPPALVTVKPDQAYQQRQRTEQLATLDDMGAVPLPVKARVAQEMLGDLYTDADLEQFINENRRPTLRLPPGEPG